MHRFVCFSLVCTLTVSGWAQVRSAKLQNREVWQIESPQLRVTITQVGGHIAEIILKGRNEINPFGFKPVPTIEPTEYVREKHEEALRWGACCEAVEWTGWTQPLFSLLG